MCVEWSICLGTNWVLKLFRRTRKLLFAVAVYGSVELSLFYMLLLNLLIHSILKIKHTNKTSITHSKNLDYHLVGISLTLCCLTLTHLLQFLPDQSSFSFFLVFKSVLLTYYLGMRVHPFNMCNLIRFNRGVYLWNTIIQDIEHFKKFFVPPLLFIPPPPLASGSHCELFMSLWFSLSKKFM